MELDRGFLGLQQGGLLGFSDRNVKPLLGRERGQRIKYEEDEETLKKDPDQIHLRMTGDYGEIFLRIAKGQGKDEQIITVMGANCNASPAIPISVNGDQKWEGELQTAVGIIKSDPYLCTPCVPED